MKIAIILEGGGRVALVPRHLHYNDKISHLMMTISLFYHSFRCLGTRVEIRLWTQVASKAT